jgi:ankyrin repeat protein
VQFLVLKGRANVKDTMKNRSTALFTACQHGSLDVVLFLLLQGKANVEATKKNGATVLVLVEQIPIMIA